MIAAAPHDLPTMKHAGCCAIRHSGYSPYVMMLVMFVTVAGALLFLVLARRGRRRLGFKIHAACGALALVGLWTWAAIEPVNLRFIGFFALNFGAPLAVFWAVLGAAAFALGRRRGLPNAP